MWDLCGSLPLSYLWSQHFIFALLARMWSTVDMSDMPMSSGFCLPGRHQRKVVALVDSAACSTFSCQMSPFGLARPPEHSHDHELPLA